MRRAASAFALVAAALIIPCLAILIGCNPAVRRSTRAGTAEPPMGACAVAKPCTAPDYPVSSGGMLDDVPAGKVRRLPGGLKSDDGPALDNAVPKLRPAPRVLPSVKLMPVPGPGEDNVLPSLDARPVGPASRFLAAPKPAPLVKTATPAPLIISRSLNAGPAAANKIDAAAPLVRMVRNRRITLDFEVENVGPSGVAGIDLWYTRDRRSWAKYEGANQSGSTYVVEVDGDGRYGFTLLARNGMGYGKSQPQPGDVPQVLVEVDSTSPFVQLTGTKILFPEGGPALCIYWRATDKNLDHKPIRLCYAKQADGPWQPIVSNVENWGSYLWKMPAGVPAQFYIRVEATDRAGNSAADQCKQPIMLDGAQPRVSVRGVY